MSIHLVYCTVDLGVGKDSQNPFLDELKKIMHVIFFIRLVVCTAAIIVLNNDEDTRGFIVKLVRYKN